MTLIAKSIFLQLKLQGCTCHGEETWCFDINYSTFAGILVQFLLTLIVIVKKFFLLTLDFFIAGLNIITWCLLVERVNLPRPRFLMFWHWLQYIRWHSGPVFVDTHRDREEVLPAKTCFLHCRFEHLHLMLSNNGWEQRRYQCLHYNALCCVMWQVIFVSGVYRFPYRFQCTARQKKFENAID